MKIFKKLNLLFFLNIFLLSLQAKNIYIVSPIGIGANASVMFDQNYDIRDEVHKPFYMLANKLRSLGHNITFVQSGNECCNAECILFFGPDISLINNFINSQAKKIYFSFEPPIINPSYLQENYKKIFSKMFLLLDDLANNSTTFKFFYPQPNLEILERNAFSKRKFCTFVAGYRLAVAPNDLYSERIKIVDFFDKSFPYDFDFYGRGWPSTYCCYKGEIKHKRDTLKNYKFCICYENSRFNGYITEKIFDAMVAGCIPVYLGAKNIKNYIPSNCFIDRSRFKSDYDLYNFMKRIDEKQYQAYLKNAEIFLKSSLAQKFSVDNFVDTVLFAIS